MWTIISTIFSGLLSPLTSLAQTWLNGKNNIDLQKVIVNGQVDTTLINAQVQIFQAQAELAKTKVMQFLYVVFALPLAFYLGKVYIWDAALHLGTTDAVRGDVSTWAGMIVGFIFFHSALETWVRK